MRRLVFVFLLIVVPFQLVWGAAVPYCAHETMAGAAKHFGHHEHRHQADVVAPSAEADNGDGSGAYDLDCAICHLGTSVSLPSLVISLAAVPSGVLQGENGSGYSSHVPSGLERPDRAEIATAARFGGGVAFGLLPA